VSDLGAGELKRLLDLAAEMKADPLGWRGAQAGKVLACVFSKPSTRTRVSLEAAAQRLGMLPLILRPDELQLGRGEPISDTGRVLSSYVDAITIRTFAQSDVEDLAAAATVPVINALTDAHHPCQALSGPAHDPRALRWTRGSSRRIPRRREQRGALTDGGRCTRRHGDCRLHPYGYRPHAEIEIATRAIIEPDPFEAVRGAQVVYTDVWVSMGEDSERDARLNALADYQVSSAIMDAASHDAVFMHRLPAHRGEEVAAEVIDGPRSVVFQQAANRLPTEQALIHTLIERWE
jgi:ornithine carbamoyltransferase